MFQILKTDRQKEKRYMLLLDDLARTKSDLENAYANFENVVDPDLIDASIYEVKAVQMRYKFLLSCVKEEEFPQDVLMANLAKKNALMRSELT